MHPETYAMLAADRIAGLQAEADRQRQARGAGREWIRPWFRDRVVERTRRRR